MPIDRWKAKDLTSKTNMVAQSAMCARDHTHASPRTCSERRPLHPTARLSVLDRGEGGGPCRTGARAEHGAGEAASTGLRAATAAAARPSPPRPSPAPEVERDHGALRAADGRLLVAPSRRRSPPRLRRGWGWRLVRWAGMRRHGEGSGAPTCAHGRACAHTSIDRDVGGPVTPGDRAMGSEMAPAMVLKAVPSPAVHARKKKKRSAHHRPRAVPAR